jgi:ribonuclease HI
VKVQIYSDGGARGNPGPAAGAYLILDETDSLLKKGSVYLGRRTNNQAEYEALISALKAAAQLGARELICYLDSELVCRHLTGQYKVKNVQLRELYEQVQALRRGFVRVTFLNVPRTNHFIQQADELVNHQLDITGY